MDNGVKMRNGIIETAEDMQKIRQIERLQKKLDIAVKALKEYADEGSWCDCLSWNGWMEDSEVVCGGQFGENGFEPAQKALKEMEEV